MKYFNKNILIFFTVIAIPILILWAGFTINNMVNEKSYIVDYSVNENWNNDKNTSVLIDNYLTEIVENIKVVRDADEVSAYISNPSKVTKDNMTDLFVRIMENKQYYDQLRFIDVDGLEKVRIDKDENISVVEESSLQSKSDRYYFQEAIQRDYDDIYISPLDLNVENGEIEVPILPMIRIATSIFNEDGSIAGIIIINYKADIFINLIQNHEEHQRFSSYEFYVLNSEGQYIIHPDHDLNYSFAYEEIDELKFEQEHLTLWNRMVADNFKGNYIQKNTVVTYYDLLDASKNKGLVNEEKWVMVHFMDSSNLLSFSTVFNELFLTYNGIIAFMILNVVYVIAIILHQLRNKNLELDITKMITSTTNDAIVITDAKTKIVFVNKEYEIATGYQKEEVIGSKPNRFKSGKHGDTFYKKMWMEINEKGIWEGTLWDKKKDGLLFPKKLKIIAVIDKKSKKAHHYIGIFSDLSSNKRKSDTYQALNFSEGKMMIPNEEIMIELLQESIQNKNYKFMVVYISIKNYNQLISVLEKNTGDPVKIFMDLAKPFIKADDFIAQTGRNLFALIIGKHNIEESYETFVLKLYKHLSKVFMVDDRDMFFKVRLGVSYWPNEAEDIKKLLLNSMIALEWAMHKGESEIAFYKECMIEELNEENEIEGYLKKAIDKNELYMVYQPQINIQTNEIIGMEALLRWNNDELGFVSPAVFIPIAEKNHLMIEIGDWIIRKVCEDLSLMEKEYKLTSKGLRCAINMSAVQMEEIGFYDKLVNSMKDYKIKTSQLEIEITESLILSNEKRIIEVLDRLRRDGMRVAIDDFGTGYSSLSYLNTLPIDKIKIDRSFIKNYPKEDDGKLVNILVDMSKKLGMKVLTEGAETEEQVNFLKSIGCHYIQGYYYSKPLKKDDFIKYINKADTVGI